MALLWPSYNQKPTKIQDFALKMLFADYNFSHMELLENADTSTILINDFV